MQDLTTKHPDGKHPLECELPQVGGENGGIPGGMTDAIAAAEAVRTAVISECGVAYDPTYAAVPDDTDYDVPPGPAPDRVIPYTATGANPSYPQDAASGFECAEAPAEEPEPAPAPAAKAAPEPEVEELNPAGIPAPPD